MSEYIEIKGARVNNLKNVDVKIPRDKFVVIAGVSGILDEQTLYLSVAIVHLLLVEIVAFNALP